MSLLYTSEPSFISHLLTLSPSPNTYHPTPNIPMHEVVPSAVSAAVRMLTIT